MRATVKPENQSSPTEGVESGPPNRTWPAAAPRERTSYSSRLIVGGGMLAICAIVVAVSILVPKLRTQQIGQSERDLESLSMVLAEQIDRNLQSIGIIQDSWIDRINALGITSPAEFARRMSGHEIYLRLQDQISALPHIDAMVLTDPDGKLINFSRGWPIPLIQNPDSMPAHFFKTSPRRTYIGTPVKSPANGIWVLSIARKVTGPNGEFLGTLLGVMRLQYFDQLFRSVARHRDRSIALFTRDGKLVARYPRDEALRGTSFAQTDIFTKLLSKGAAGTVQQTSLNGRGELLVSGRLLPHHPMAVVITKTVDNALANWRYTVFSIAGAAVIIALLIGAGAFYIARRIRNNLEAQNRQLDAALNNMSQGLVMFDASSRLVVCNQRYLQMYGFPPEVAGQHRTLRDLLRLKVERGTFRDGSVGDPEYYAAWVREQISSGKAASLTFELQDGRTIAIRNQPIQGGGWVATHDDITEARRSEASFRLLFENNPVPMWVIDRDSFRFLAVNEAAIAQYGYTRERFLSMTTLDIRPIEDRERLAQRLRAAGKDRNGEEIWRHLKADGSQFEACIYTRALGYNGRPACLVAIYDVTGRRNAEEQLRQAQLFLDTVIENVPAPILVKDVAGCGNNAADFRYSLVNRAFEEFFGDTRENIVGKSAKELYPTDRADFIIAENQNALRSEQPIIISDHPFNTKNNAIRIATAKTVAIRDDRDRPRYLVTVLQDITERKRTELGIARMAHHDHLTDLPNRTTFHDALEAALDSAAKTGEQFVVLSLDLDGFKEANDTYGHSVGDTLLCKTAQRLQAAAADAFAARLGGDEFALLLIGGPEAAAELADRVLAALKEDVNIDGRTIPVGATMGGAVYPIHGTDAKSLMVNADIALYRAKAEARGTLLLFDLQMGQQIRDRRALQDDLRSALQREQFLLHYQPQKRMSGETIGFEALLRWQCPNRGMISPEIFVPIAEETKLIIPIGEWVLREACREAASWSEPLSIAVNISPVQFRNGDLPRVVQTVLLETGLSPSRLELEITEGVLIDDFSRAMSVLARLKSTGVRIALDDFGAGYSSLSYLHAFPFDKIKIDRSFIGDLEYNQYSIAIVRAVIDLGHTLDVPICAEGVETAEQHAALVHKGCDEVQGFLTGRPLPIESYADTVGRQHTGRTRLRLAS